MDSVVNMMETGNLVRRDAQIGANYERLQSEWSEQSFSSIYQPSDELGRESFVVPS